MNAAAPLTPGDGEHHARLSVRDEIELRAYFSSHAPPAPGEQSGFGAMCRRLGNSRNPRSNERPAPGTPWTEIVECRRAYAGANFDGEDAMLAYLDARRRFRSVCEALSRLSVREQRVLDAYYGSEPCEHPLGQLATVASLTDTANRRNRARAARGMHEPVEVTVRWLAAATAPEAREALAKVKLEARELLRLARSSYVLVRARLHGIRGV